MENVDGIVARYCEHGKALVHGFVEEELRRALCDQIRDLYQDGEFRSAAIGGGASRQVRREIRADEIFWWDGAAPSPAQRECLDRFEQLRGALNRELQLGLWEFECHFAKYAPGAFYLRHIDRIAGDTRRRVSCVLYLNEAWRPEDNGVLRLYIDNSVGASFEDIVPEGGRLVIFDSAKFSHEVLPSRRERLSVAGWFKTRQ